MGINWLFLLDSCKFWVLGILDSCKFWVLGSIFANQIAVQARAAVALAAVMAEISSSSPVPTPAPVPTPVPPTPAPGTWEVSGSGCEETEGRCIQSKNYPSQYGNSEACTVTIYGNFNLNVEAFSTEDRYDFLTMGGTRYSGSSGPSSGTYSGTIAWASDSSVTNSGWRVCKA